MVRYLFKCTNNSWALLLFQHWKRSSKKQRIQHVLLYFNDNNWRVCCTKWLCKLVRVSSSKQNLWRSSTCRFLLSRLLMWSHSWCLWWDEVICSSVKVLNHTSEPTSCLYRSTNTLSLCRHLLLIWFVILLFRPWWSWHNDYCLSNNEPWSDIWSHNKWTVWNSNSSL